MEEVPEAVVLPFAQLQAFLESLPEEACPQKCCVPYLCRLFLHCFSGDRSAVSDQEEDLPWLSHPALCCRADSWDLWLQMQQQCLQERPKTVVPGAKGAPRRRTGQPSHTTSSCLPILSSLFVLRSQVCFELHVKAHYTCWAILACALSGESNTVDDKEHFVAFD